MGPGAWPELDRGKLFAARAAAVAAQPYLATALYAMSVVPSHQVPTMAVDRYWRCYVSPRFVAALDVGELAAVWLHEVAHLVRDHHRRADRLRERSRQDDAAAAAGLASSSGALDPRHLDREALRLNLAMDCEINDDLLSRLPDPPADRGPENPIRLPDGVVTRESLHLEESAGALFEQIVRLIPPSALRGRLVWLDCGSGAHASHRPWELGPDGANPLSEHAADAVRLRVRHAVRGAPGTAPAGWRRWASEEREPTQDWRHLLGQTVRASLAATAGAIDYSYRRPGRRTQSLGGAVVLPGLRRPLSEVAVVVDTSRSVSDNDLAIAIGEIAGITRAVGIAGNRVAVYSCDAAVHTAQQVCATEQLTLIGGGGTDLRAGISKAVGQARPPDVLVVLTDGCTPWPSSAPPCRVVAGLFDDPAITYDDDGEQLTFRPPDWAHAITLR
ncbi:MAG: VWA-like domain-containing protein [Kineosporiaceae bacterium]